MIKLELVTPDSSLINEEYVNWVLFQLCTTTAFRCTDPAGNDLGLMWEPYSRRTRQCIFWTTSALQFDQFAYVVEPMLHCLVETIGVVYGTPEYTLVMTAWFVFHKPRCTTVEDLVFCMDSRTHDDAGLTLQERFLQQYMLYQQKPYKKHTVAHYTT